MHTDILLTMMLCNAADALHKSVKQNFNLSFFLGFMLSFEKKWAVFLKI